MAHRAPRINRIQADRRRPSRRHHCERVDGRRSQRGPRLLDQRLAVVEFTAVAATHRDQRLAPQRFRLCRGTRAAWIIGSARSCRASTILRFGPAGSLMPLRQVDLDEFTGRGGQPAIAGQEWGVQDLRQGDIVGVMDGHGVTHRPDPAGQRLGGIAADRNRQQVSHSFTCQLCECGIAETVDREIAESPDRLGREPRLSYPSDTLSGCNGDGVTAAILDQRDRRATARGATTGPPGMSAP